VTDVQNFDHITNDTAKKSYIDIAERPSLAQPDHLFVPRPLAARQ
jgi:hypothetical protein